MDEAERLTRLAELAVRIGANVQPGQLVVVNGMVENAPLMREIARAAYRAGAQRVEASYRDMHFVRALIELGPVESLGMSAPWDLAMVETSSRTKGLSSRSAATPCRRCSPTWTVRRWGERDRASWPPSSFASSVIT